MKACQNALSRRIAPATDMCGRGKFYIRTQSKSLVKPLFLQCTFQCAGYIFIV